MEFERFQRFVAVDGAVLVVVPYLSPFAYAAGALPAPSFVDVLASTVLGAVGLGVLHLASANVRRPLAKSLGLSPGRAERASTPSVRYLTMFRASLALLIADGVWQGAVFLSERPLWPAWPPLLYGVLGLAAAGAAGALWAALERNKVDFRVAMLTPEFV